MIWHPEDGDLPELPDGWVWQTLDEVEADFAAVEAEAQRLVDLLAWVLRQAAVALDLSDRANWPVGLWVTDWPDTWKTALIDQLVFDLARHQVAADLRAEPERDLDPIREANLMWQASFLLTASTPTLRGKRPGRRAIVSLIHRLAEWTLHNDPEGEEPLAEARIADAIADTLTRHPTLEAHPEWTLSAEAVRAILRRKPVVSSAGQPS